MISHKKSPVAKMQLQQFQSLVSKLKENPKLDIETTTLGKFLGVRRDAVAMKLGTEVLNRPVLVTSSVDGIQILDLKSGWVIVLKSLEEALPKLVDVFGDEKAEEYEMVFNSEHKTADYNDILSREIHCENIHSDLRDINEAMQESASVEKKVELIGKTIDIFEAYKNNGATDAEIKMVERIQQKLNSMTIHAKSKLLAPGQIPSVFEIAIWKWVN